MTIPFSLARLSDRVTRLFLDGAFENPDSPLHRAICDALLDELTHRARSRASGESEAEAKLALPVLSIAELEDASEGLARSVAVVEVAVLASDDVQGAELAVAIEFLRTLLDCVKLEHSTLVAAMRSGRVN